MTILAGELPHMMCPQGPSTCRFSLRVINYAFALLGLAVLGYAAYLLWEVKHNQGISGYPW